MENFGSPGYWERCYANRNEAFDWLEDYSTLKDIIKR